MKNVKKFLAIGAMCLTAFPLAGCIHTGIEDETTKEAETRPLGGDFQVVRYPGLPGVNGSAPALWTPTQYTQLQSLWAHGCVEQLQPQLDGTHWKSIGKTLLRDVPAGGIGVGIGAVAGFPGAGFVPYGKYGSGATLGNVLPYADDRHEQSVNGEGGQCMNWQIYWANSRDGQLGGIGTITDYDIVQGNEIPVPNVAPSLPSQEESERTKTNARLQPTQTRH